MRQLLFVAVAVLLASAGRLCTAVGEGADHDAGQKIVYASGSNHEVELVWPSGISLEGEELRAKIVQTIDGKKKQRNAKFKLADLKKDSLTAVEGGHRFRVRGGNVLTIESGRGELKNYANAEHKLVADLRKSSAANGKADAHIRPSEWQLAVQGLMDDYSYHVKRTLAQDMYPLEKAVPADLRYLATSMPKSKAEWRKYKRAAEDYRKSKQAALPSLEQLDKLYRPAMQALKAAIVNDAKLTQGEEKEKDREWLESLAEALKDAYDSTTLWAKEFMEPTDLDNPPINEAFLKAVDAPGHEASPAVRDALRKVLEALDKMTEPVPEGEQQKTTPNEQQQKKETPNEQQQKKDTPTEQQPKTTTEQQQRRTTNTNTNTNTNEQQHLRPNDGPTEGGTTSVEQQGPKPAGEQNGGRFVEVRVGENPRYVDPEAFKLFSSALGAALGAGSSAAKKPLKGIEFGDSTTLNIDLGNTDKFLTYALAPHIMQLPGVYDTTLDVSYRLEALEHNIAKAARVVWDSVTFRSREKSRAAKFEEQYARDVGAGRRRRNPYIGADLHKSRTAGDQRSLTTETSKKIQEDLSGVAVKFKVKPIFGYDFSGLLKEIQSSGEVPDMDGLAKHIKKVGVETRLTLTPKDPAAANKKGDFSSDLKLRFQLNKPFDGAERRGEAELTWNNHLMASDDLKLTLNLHSFVTAGFEDTKIETKDPMADFYTISGFIGTEYKQDQLKTGLLMRMTAPLNDDLGMGSEETLFTVRPSLSFTFGHKHQYELETYAQMDYRPWAASEDTKRYMGGAFLTVPLDRNDNNRLRFGGEVGNLDGFMSYEVKTTLLTQFPSEWFDNSSLGRDYYRTDLGKRSRMGITVGTKFQEREEGLETIFNVGLEFDF